MDIKRTVKNDVICKDCIIQGNAIVDDCGEEIDVIRVAKQVYGMNPFKLTMTASDSEEVELDSEE